MKIARVIASLSLVFVSFSERTAEAFTPGPIADVLAASGVAPNEDEPPAGQKTPVVAGRPKVSIYTARDCAELSGGVGYQYIDEFLSRENGCLYRLEETAPGELALITNDSVLARFRSINGKEVKDGNVKYTISELAVGSSVPLVQWQDRTKSTSSGGSLRSRKTTVTVTHAVAGPFLVPLAIPIKHTQSVSDITLDPISEDGSTLRYTNVNEDRQYHRTITVQCTFVAGDQRSGKTPTDLPAHPNGGPTPADFVQAALEKLKAQAESEGWNSSNALESESIATYGYGFITRLQTLCDGRFKINRDGSGLPFTCAKGSHPEADAIVRLLTEHGFDSDISRVKDDEINKKTVRRSDYNGGFHDVFEYYSRKMRWKNAHAALRRAYRDFRPTLLNIEPSLDPQARAAWVARWDEAVEVAVDYSRLRWSGSLWNEDKFNANYLAFPGLPAGPTAPGSD